LQLRLRDSEVANDDFERQARNTTSSLEDMESKHNMAVERAVLLEEEIKIGEQERENLRIEAQRLKEELSDLKIEAELLQDKVRKQESRHLSSISTDISVLESPTFDTIMSSPNSASSSPLMTTPTDLKSLAGESIAELTELTDPPSPPMSDASAPLPRASTFQLAPAGSALRKTRMQSMDQQAAAAGGVGAVTAAAKSARMRPPMTSTSRTSGTRSATTGSALLRSSIGPSSSTTAPVAPASNTTRTTRPASSKTPGSNSLSHIRNLTAQMQRLEDRVQRARSKLPATPSAMSSPRNSVGPGGLPSSSMIRARQRGPSSVASSSQSIGGDESTPTVASTQSRHVPRLSTSGVSRISFGPLPNRGVPTCASAESDVSMSRPSSRASSSARPESRTSVARPPSRTSFSSARAPMPMRPRSSLGGNNNFSRSVGPGSRPVDLEDTEEEPAGFRTPSRRSTFGKLEAPTLAASGSGIPMPGRRQSSGIARRTSSVSVTSLGVTGSMIGRPSSSMGLRPPSSAGRRTVEDLGETY
jgi:hypothetical protein